MRWSKNRLIFYLSEEDFLDDECDIHHLKNGRQRLSKALLEKNIEIDL